MFVRAVRLPSASYVYVYTPSEVKRLSSPTVYVRVVLPVVMLVRFPLSS